MRPFYWLVLLAEYWILLALMTIPFALTAIELNSLEFESIQQEILIEHRSMLSKHHWQ